MADAERPVADDATTPRTARADAARARRRDRLEWLITIGTGVLVFGILGYLTFQEGRAERDGFMAGIAWRLLQGVLVVVLVYALFALGLNMQFGFAGLINFGHVASLALGAYTAAILSWGCGTIFGIEVGLPRLRSCAESRATGFSAIYDAPFLEAAWYALVIILVAATVATLFALLLGIPTLKLREDYLAIVTIGAAEIFRFVFINEAQLTNGPTGLSVRVPANSWVGDRDGWRGMISDLNEATNMDLDPYYTFMLLLAVIAFAIMYAVFEWLWRSPWGRVVKAIREDEDVAASLGKNVFKYKMQALILGSITAAIAGVLYAWYFRFLNPQSFLPIVTFYAWIVLTVGGIGNNKGPLVGAFIMWGLFELARNLETLPLGGEAFEVGGAAQVAFIGILLIVVMMFRPQGVLGRKEDLLYGK